jgi:hypothetical protein
MHILASSPFSSGRIAFKSKPSNRDNKSTGFYIPYYGRAILNAERTTHAASCHCGAVEFTVTLESPFPKYPVNKCNCSICFQNGYLLVYPCRRDIVFLKGESTFFSFLNDLVVTRFSGYDNLGSYAFNTKTKSHMFCKTCGSSIGIDFQRPAQGETDPAKDELAINVRWSLQTNG